MRAQLTIIAALLAAGPAGAQERNLTLLGIPSATVAPSGVGYIALSGTDDNPVNDRVDGSLEFGLGLGSAEASVGVQAKLVVTSLTDGFGDSGYLGFRLSRRIAAGGMPLYLGLEADALGGWGEAEGNKETVSLMLTGFMLAGSGETAMPVMYTIGAGNRVRNDDTDPGLFAGIGAGFTPYLGGSAAWTGDTLDLGLSLRPSPQAPFVVNVTLSDATDREDERRLSLAAAWIFRTGIGR